MEDLSFMEKLKQQIKWELEVEAHEGDCFWCDWFNLREEKPRNRVCRCPLKLEYKNMKCQNWKLDPNPKNRVRALT
jgi:hypothetical protein